MAGTLIDLLADGFNGYKRYLMRQFRTISEYDAEDIIQQTALKFIYKGNDLYAIDQLRAYIYRSLSNTAKDHFKKQHREIPAESFDTWRRPGRGVTGSKGGGKGSHQVGDL